LGLLPASIASLVAVNKTDQVPAFVQTTLTNLQKAIPGVTAAVQNEVAYDKNLFGQPGGASTSPFGATALDADLVSRGPLPRLASRTATTSPRSRASIEQSWGKPHRARGHAQ